jgi:hypothetical protein
MWTWLTEIGSLFAANAATAAKDLVAGGIQIEQTVVTDLKSLFTTGVRFSKPSPSASRPQLRLHNSSTQCRKKRVPP